MKKQTKKKFTKPTCEFCGKEFESTEEMYESEEHLCGGCGNRQDSIHCEKLNGLCIECF